MPTPDSTAPIASLVLQDPDGRPVELASLWQDQGAVLVWLRHFGCLFCREQVAEMLPHLERIHAAGAELVFISTGAPQFARAFREDHHITAPILVDPERRSYQALGFARGLGASLDPRTALSAARAIKAGFRQGRTQGDVAQQGGVLVVDKGGGIRYAHRSAHAGDHPPVEAILAALPRPG